MKNEYFKPYFDYIFTELSSQAGGRGGRAARGSLRAGQSGSSSSHPPRPEIEASIRRIPFVRWPRELEIEPGTTLVVNEGYVVGSMIRIGEVGNMYTVTVGGKPVKIKTNGDPSSIIFIDLIIWVRLMKDAAPILMADEGFPV